MYNKQNYMISKLLRLAIRSIEHKKKLSEQLLEKKEILGMKVKLKVKTKVEVTMN